MATARNPKTLSKTAAPRKAPEVPGPAPLHPILRVFDEIYRFLASVKLAVICIFTLAMVLAGATIFESGYGTAASRQFVYQNKAFAVLLAFLAANIFCAATIRFPWKKRQIGFVVTHIGLLVILAGAFVSLSRSDEGQIGMPEGTTSNQLVRIDHSVVRVEKLDPATGKFGDPYVLPLDHGAFNWNSEELASSSKDPAYRTKVWTIRAAFGAAATALLAFIFVWVVRRPASLGVVRGSFVVSMLIGVTSGLGVAVLMTPSGPRREVLTDAADPFTFVVKDYHASSGRQEMRAEPDPTGYPAVRLALPAKPPRQEVAINGLEGRDWFGAPTSSFGRTFREGTPAAVVYQYANGPNAANVVDDFLHPPASPLTQRAARIHYLDSAKKPRVYEWLLDKDQAGKTVDLPGSDLKITLVALEDKEADPDRDRMAATIAQATGEGTVRVAQFTAQRGEGAKKKYFAVASLPVLPNAQDDEPDDAILSIGYFCPPRLSARSEGMGGRLGQIEVLQTEDGKFYARGFGRDGLMGTPGPIEVGEAKPLVAGARMPMQLSIKVVEALPKARIRKVWIPVELAREDRENAVPAIQGEMTVKGVTKKVSLIRTNDLNTTAWETVTFPDATYQVAFDFDRMKFPFTLALTKFEPGKDPGSPSPATFRSDVTLTDPELDLKEEPHAIYMNNPLTHRGWSFYQSSYHRVTDPQTGQEEGAYQSVFQVHYDPAWKVIYGGCLFMVIGIFLQFYMRAGLFSDGGKRERAIAAAKAEKASGSGATTGPAAAEPRAASPGAPVEDL